ncbi:hypothetical protein NDU88_001005 [Pleurodeles waltl]|uniref:Uncharacterized protein n=1 Tax=Pleurodeles waltl TaxID=8319 RepID=A0AAV7VZ70_PLEWA|nr:hypothetical protein NDU88_001005 [Pleurodeles waltl]
MRHSAVPSGHNPGPKFKSCHSDDRRSWGLKRNDRRIYSTSRNHGAPPWSRDRPENSPRKLCGCRNPKWQPRQNSELAAAAALG